MLPRLNIIVASTRPGRVGRLIADWFAGIATAHGGFDVHIVDLAEIKLPFLDEPHVPEEGIYLHEHTRRWSEINDEADAFVFVMPEYNRGFTAPLKNALDFLFHEWRDKPVALVGYGMSSAGLRAADMIKPVLVALKMVPVPDTVVIPLRQVLDDEGRLKPMDAMRASAKEVLDELWRLNAALATLRAPAQDRGRTIPPQRVGCQTEGAP